MIMNGPHWIKQWIADLAMLNEQFRDENGTVDFEALGREEFQFRTALITRNFEKSERAKTVFENAKAAYDASVKNGKLGGRPRKDATTSETTNTDDAHKGRGRSGADSLTPARQLPMPSKEEFYDFVRAEGLDEADARDWFEMTVVDRDGRDRDGRRIGNWKGACRKFCKSRKDGRAA